MTEQSIESENARFFFKDIADRNNQMLTSMHQYNNYTLVLLGAIWTIVGKYVIIDNPTILTGIEIALNITIGIILLWRYLVHEIDNDIAKNYSRLVFYEHALTGFQSTPDEQSIFYNLTKHFPGWKNLALNNSWENRYRAFNYLCNKKKLGERGHQHLDKIAIWAIVFFSVIDVIVYMIILFKYNFFNIYLIQGFPSLGSFFIGLFFLKVIFLGLIIKHLFENCRQLEPTNEDVKRAFTCPLERDMVEKDKTHGLNIAWTLTGVGLFGWAFGAVTNTEFCIDFGIPAFFAGAAFVAVSKTLIYQDSCNAELKEEWKKGFAGIEEKIDKINNNK
jgi:hypothetical protein